MLHSYLQVLNPIIGLTINIIVQIFSFKYFVKFELFRSVFLGFVVGLLSVFTFEFYIFLRFSSSFYDFIGIFITNTITYSLLGYCYFHFINLGETARRIRILRELYDSKGGLTMEEILLRYNTKDILERRVHRLITTGQIVFKNDRYYIGKSIMLLIGRLIIIMKLIILGKKSEFD